MQRDKWKDHDIKSLITYAYRCCWMDCCCCRNLLKLSPLSLSITLLGGEGALGRWLIDLLEDVAMVARPILSLRQNMVFRLGLKEMCHIVLRFAKIFCSISNKRIICNNVQPYVMLLKMHICMTITLVLIFRILNNFPLISGDCNGSLLYYLTFFVFISVVYYLNFP